MFQVIKSIFLLCSFFFAQKTGFCHQNKIISAGEQILSNLSLCIKSLRAWWIIKMWKRAKNKCKERERERKSEEIRKHFQLVYMDQGSHSQVLNLKPNFQRCLLKAPSTSDFPKLGILGNLALIWNSALEIRRVSGNAVLLYLHEFLLRAESRSQVAKICKQPLKHEGKTQHLQTVGMVLQRAWFMIL